MTILCQIHIHMQIKLVHLRGVGGKMHCCRGQPSGFGGAFVPDDSTISRAQHNVATI